MCFSPDKRKVVLTAIILIYLTLVSFSLVTVANMTKQGLYLVYKCLGVASATNFLSKIPFTAYKMYQKSTITLAELS